MPEIIGDDLVAFLKNARNKGIIPADMPVPFANTPSFNGSHIHGYDAMLLSILQTLTEGKKVEGRCTGKVNLIPGFDANTGNFREYKRLFAEFGVPVDDPGRHLRRVRRPLRRHLPHLSRRHQAG